MQIEIPDSTIEEVIEAIVIQENGSIKTSDIRWAIAKRIAYHVGEILIGVVEKELRSRGLYRNPQMKY